MANYQIRKINSNEIDSANHLLNKLIRDEQKYDDNINLKYTVGNYYQNRPKDSCILVATDSPHNIIGYLYGYIVAAPVFSNPKAILDALYVEEKYRKSGIANQLINAFKDWCHINNIKIIELTVCSENIEALNLYKRHSAVPTKYTMQIKL